VIRLVKGLRSAQHIDSGLLVFATLSLLLPLLCLAGIGLFAVVTEGYWVALLITLLVTSLGISIPFWIYRYRRSPTLSNRPETDGDAESLVQASPEWADFDLAVWEKINLFIMEKIQPDTEWTELEPLAFRVAKQVATHYYADSKEPVLEFSAPEFLLMLEELSRRYRNLLNTHVPYVEKASIKLIKRGYHHRNKVMIAKKFYDAYRVLRIFSPEGVLAEARGQLTGHAFDQLSTNMHLKLQRATLQEATSVAIDLYSGRFQVADREMGEDQVAKTDASLLAPSVEPLRIAFVGQVSAGKSSLINGLMGTMAAETSTLPSPAGITLYQCKREGVDLLRLVDLPGLDGTEKRHRHILEQMTQSDLVIWVLQANRPARSLDKTLKEKFEDFYQQPANRSRRKPTVVAAISQVDRLPPAAEWEPPYDLEQPNCPKAKVIADAVAFNQELLKPDLSLAISVAEHKPNFNMEKLEAVISDAYQQGIQTQLNRRRHAATESVSGPQIGRLFQLGKSLWHQAGVSDEHQHPPS